jgi:hypothetical protein
MEHTNGEMNFNGNGTQLYNNECKNCKGKSFVHDALGNKFFCPKCHK